MHLTGLKLDVPFLFSWLFYLFVCLYVWILFDYSHFMNLIQWLQVINNFNYSLFNKSNQIPLSILQTCVKRKAVRKYFFISCFLLFIFIHTIWYNHISACICSFVLFFFWREFISVSFTSIKKKPKTSYVIKKRELHRQKWKVLISSIWQNTLSEYHFMASLFLSRSSVHDAETVAFGWDAWSPRELYFG
jgi:hypothetical protein